MENTKSGKSNSGPVRDYNLSSKKKDVSIGTLGLESIDIEGKTPTEAIKKALAILKVDRSKVKVKILSEEQRGLFGMEGARPAKVRVTVSRPFSYEEALRNKKGRDGLKRKRLDKVS